MAPATEVDFVSDGANHTAGHNNDVHRNTVVDIIGHTETAEVVADVIFVIFGMLMLGCPHTIIYCIACQSLTRYGSFFGDSSLGPSGVSPTATTRDGTLSMLGLASMAVSIPLPVLKLTCTLVIIYHCRLTAMSDD